MANLKSLAKDTAIYGLSSIVGRFLNNLLVPHILGIWRNNGLTVIAPHPLGDLRWCRGESNGIKTSWHLDGKRFLLEVDVPLGQSVKVRMPYSGREQTVGEGHHSLTDEVMTESR